ncbi:MAG: RluA family pseudouridine synthase [Bacilli bacterium]|nr:RluA family pseudouridine synthase [Bacilli bacterium]
MKLLVEEETNERLDKYISQKTDISRSLILKMLKDDFILVNQKKEKPSYRVELNDTIDIKDGYIKEINIEPKKMDLNIVYEDNDLIVIDKPSGLVVHPGAGNYDNTLVNGLMYYTDDLSIGTDENRPGIVHRIDKDTSGLILISKNNKTQELLSDMFAKHTIKREYIALVHGVLESDKAIIDAPIGRDKNDRKKMSVTANNSKKAITHLTVLKRYKKFTLVKLNLETGRTHQIRVHMKYIKHPIYNDPVYSNDNATEFGQFLHSYKMSFVHPITKKELSFTSKLPKEFEDFINSLEEL